MSDCSQKLELTGMSSRERMACGTLCLCLAVLVLSAVAMVYLTVIIYVPAQRELSAGILENSVMCTTIQKKNIVDDIFACKWSSCSEWCLSKGGGACVHLYVSVRSNGTDVLFEGCSGLTDTQCPTMDSTTALKKNCKEDYQCTRLEKQFRCEDGSCWNISSVYSCSWDPLRDVDPHVLDCSKKRNCVDLSGLFDCHQGWCRRIRHWHCQRRCNDIPIAAKNVAIIAGDGVLTAHCQRAVNARTGEVVWHSREGLDHGEPPAMLMASCTEVALESDSQDHFWANDCINGTLMPISHLAQPQSDSTNFTVITVAHRELGLSYRLDDQGNEDRIPFEQEIRIYNRSRLMINHEGCVNTLQGECSEFYQMHDKDGRNATSPSRFPCFYAPHDDDFVVLRYDLTKTKWLFFLFFMVPASMLIVSCAVLFTCSRILSVDNQGHMNINCCHSSQMPGRSKAAAAQSADHRVSLVVQPL